MRGWRSRWAPIGAAVAVSMGAGGFLIAEAASSPESDMVLIDPVRILDTRDPVSVGLPGPFVYPIDQSRARVRSPRPMKSVATRSCTSASSRVLQREAPARLGLATSACSAAPSSASRNRISPCARLRAAQGAPMVGTTGLEPGTSTVSCRLTPIQLPGNKRKIEALPGVMSCSWL